MFMTTEDKSCGLGQSYMTYEKDQDMFVLFYHPADVEMVHQVAEELMNLDEEHIAEMLTSSNYTDRKFAQRLLDYRGSINEK